MPNGPASFLAPSSLGQGKGGSQPGPPGQPEGHPRDLGTKAVLHTPHLFPFSEGFLEKEARSLLGA